jgi:DUF1680 family protein
MLKKSFLWIFVISISVLAACKSTKPATQASQPRDYPILPVPFSEVAVQDQFWLPRMEINATKTIQFAFKQSEDTGRIKNFDFAAAKIETGIAGGEFCTQYPFDDSDVFKIIEGAAYSLQVKYDKRLDQYVDSLITKIGNAQEPDGYLYTNRTINPEKTHEWAGNKRWVNDHELSHELYNVGHLYEAAVAHFQATGKRTLLNIAIKNANLVVHDLGWGKLVEIPGHQVIEMGLVKLYRITGDQRYLDEAKFFLDARGKTAYKEQYNQSHKPVIEQTEAVGHAVRAGYMFSGMADVAALTGDEGYVNAIDRIWEDVVRTKLYVTGGVGQTGGNEGFGTPYDLPNATAYCETCASIANVFWNHRLFLMRGDAKYIDVMERTMYNALLSGVSLSGDRFFYPNVLESNGQHQRQAWFGCACCPSNVSRFLPSLPGYIYAQDAQSVYVNLFIPSTANIKNVSGTDLTLHQESNFPWQGNVKITVNPTHSKTFAMNIRVPGWARNEAVPTDLYRFADAVDTPVILKVNGQIQSFILNKGYIKLEREWKKGDVLTLDIPMPVRQVLANEQIKQDAGRFALQKGPLVYAVEGKDQADDKVLHLVVDKNTRFTPQFEPNLLNGVETISFEAEGVKRDVATLQPQRISGKRAIKAIPYYAWANRGAGQMLVWLPYQLEHASPLPAPTLSNTAKISTSRNLKNTDAISDQMIPKTSNDQNVRFIHWWPNKGTQEWVQYDFENAKSVSKMRVYWFEDEGVGECRLPKSWRLLYKDGDTWKPVKNLSEYKVTKDAFDTLTFETVNTTALRLEIQSPDGFSIGIHEWEVSE